MKGRIILIICVYVASVIISFALGSVIQERKSNERAQLYSARILTELGMVIRQYDQKGVEQMLCYIDRSLDRLIVHFSEEAQSLSPEGQKEIRQHFNLLNKVFESRQRTDPMSNESSQVRSRANEILTHATTTPMRLQGHVGRVQRDD